MSQQAYPVPYRSQLQDKMEPGQTLSLQGKVAEGAENEDRADGGSFFINFHAGGVGPQNNIVFHISVRFNEKEVVMNTFQNGEWGKEERKKNPFKEGEKFDLRIRAHNDKFELIANQKDFYEYEHRMPLSEITHITIDGPITLDHVLWGGKYYPVPYEAGINGGLKPGKRLYVTGMPKGDSFHVNLITDSGDIALHFNPRFKEKKVVRNSQVNGEWMNEEREGDFTFEKKETFDIVVQNTDFAFQTFVNGERFGTFAHRMDPNSVTGLQVGGEVELSGIHIF